MKELPAVLPQGYRYEENLRNSIERPALLAQGYLQNDLFLMSEKCESVYLFWKADWLKSHASFLAKQELFGQGF